MHLLQNRVQLHALVNTVMNTLVPKPHRKSLTAKRLSSSQMKLQAICLLPSLALR